MRDIRRKKPEPPKPKVRAPVSKPVVEPVPPSSKLVTYLPHLPSLAVGYVHKDGPNEWRGYIGDEDAAITLMDMLAPVPRMKDVVEWINKVCEENGYELKEIVKL